MKTNLRARTVVILVTILLCVYGVINVPKSKAELMQNLKNNIRLGLDLKGGSHLVLEVQVQDAVKADAEQTVERMKEEMRKLNISYTSMEVTNLPERLEHHRCGQRDHHHQEHSRNDDERVSRPYGGRTVLYLYF